MKIRPGNHFLQFFVRHRALRVVMACIIALSAFGAAIQPQNSGSTAQAAGDRQRTASDQDLFGMVIRDPFYEYNTDPANYHEAPNRGALEQQAKELAGAGVKWIRMEFFADYDGSVPAGEINWSKYDWFVKELAPKYGLKILALLNVGMVAIDGKTLRPVMFNDPPDGGGSDPNDGSNHFIRVFTARSQAIALRYGTFISAYEIVNEPNISWDLWQDSRNGAAEIKPDRYSALITGAYRAIKNVAPFSEVIVGGIMIGSPPEGQDHDQFDYLFQLYVSPWVEQYRNGSYANRAGWNSVPWDGVAVHPYFLGAPELFSLINEFSRKLRDRGDSRSKIWITEVGAQAAPPNSRDQSPSQQEIDQAYYLRAIYSGIIENSELHNNVAHVFWFKYEDFVPGNYTHNYGLVRLDENAAHDNYASTGHVWVHKLAYKVYQELAFGYAATDRVSKEEAVANNQIYFDSTGQAIAPEFAAYWIEKGGLERFGYPISRPVMIRGYLSQFFERAVLEYHPENAGTNYEVLLRLLGNETTVDRVFEQTTQVMSADRLYFSETGHSLGGSFRKFWEETGGLAVYGYPISEEISEKPTSDGQTYTVQYFERNRFEFHPEAIGTPYEVQLGLLGATILKNDLWWR
ncbi:MAG: glycosyl hydrolase [Chloroflexota bacterium]